MWPTSGYRLTTATDSLRNFHLENDVTGVLLDCPQYAGEVDAAWFVDQLLAATVLYLQEHGGREGLVKSLAEQFGKEISAKGIKLRLVQFQQEARSYALVYLLPRYAAQLEDLCKRRLRMAEIQQEAKSIYAGEPLAGAVMAG